MSSDQRACVRCGRRRTVRPDRPTSVLCLDCQDVAGDLDELHAWLSGAPLRRRQTLRPDSPEEMAARVARLSEAVDR